MRRSAFIRPLLVLLCSSPFCGHAQLSIRLWFGGGSTSATYCASHGGVPDSVATWLESDVDAPPEYPGGSAAIVEHFQADTGCDPGPLDPRCAKDAKVLVWFIVERDGSVAEAWIDRGGCPALQERTICSVLNMQQWTPGQRGDRPVRTRVRIPVVYSRP